MWFDKDLSCEFLFKPVQVAAVAANSSNKVALLFHVDGSHLLSIEEKSKLKRKLNQQISAKGFLQIVADGAESLEVCKDEAIAHFYNLVKQVLQ